MATPRPNRKARRSWAATVKRRQFPVEGYEGVFLKAPTWDQLEEFEQLAETADAAEADAAAAKAEAAKTEGDGADAAVAKAADKAAVAKRTVPAIIQWLWSHLVVDEDGEFWDYQPGDVDLAQLDAVKDTITRVCSGEAKGTPGDGPLPTS